MVRAVRRIRGCLVVMLRLQGATYCTRLTMEESYSWPWAVPDVSAKKHQSQQGEGGSLSCGSDEGCRKSVPAGSVSCRAWAIRRPQAVALCRAGALSCADCAIRQRQAVKGSLECAPRCAASVRSARRGLHSACPKPPAPGALCHVLPPASLPEAAPVAPSAGRRR